MSWKPFLRKTLLYLFFGIFLFDSWPKQVHFTFYFFERNFFGGLVSGGLQWTHIVVLQVYASSGSKHLMKLEFLDILLTRLTVAGLLMLRFILLFFLEDLVNHFLDFIFFGKEGMLWFILCFFLFVSASGVKVFLVDGKRKSFVFKFYEFSFGLTCDIFVIMVAILTQTQENYSSCLEQRFLLKRCFSFRAVGVNSIWNLEGKGHGDFLLL